MEGQGHPDDVGDACRRSVLWILSNSSAYGRHYAFGLVEIHIGEMSEQAGVSRVSTIKSTSDLASSQSEYDGLRQCLLDSRIVGTVVYDVGSSVAMR